MARTQGRPKVKAKDMAAVMSDSVKWTKEEGGSAGAASAAQESAVVRELATGLERIADALEALVQIAGQARVKEVVHPPMSAPKTKEAPPAAEVKEPVPADVATETLRVAATVGVAKVKALLGKFGVQKAGELSEADRPKYLKALAAL